MSRFAVAHTFLAALGLAALAAAPLLALRGTGAAAAPGGCGERPVTWSERAPPSGALPGLLSVRLSDRRVTALLTQRARGLDHPAFSPDGRSLAVLSQSNGIVARLVICDLERGSLERLRLPIPVGSFPLSWGREGKTLLFLGGDVLGYGADQKPFLLHVESGKLMALGGDAPWYWNAAVLSPGSDKLALLLQLKYPGGLEPERLIVFDPVTGAFDRIAGSRQVAQIDALSWSPDGGRIVHTGYKHDDHGDLYVVDLETKRLRTLLATRAGERAPAWSPDGRSIAFVRSPPGRPRRTSIWILDVATGATRRVTWGRRDIAPAWSPDGKKIVFVRRA